MILAVVAMMATAAAVAPGPTMLTTAPEPVVVHVVGAGESWETLGARALLHPQDLPALARLNGRSVAAALPAGTRVTIPVAMLRREPITASIVAFSGAVTVAPSGGAAAPASLGLPVAEGSRITTGANSFVTLAMPDGSRVTLPSQSAVRVEALHTLPLDGRRERRFFIEAGRGEFNVMKRQQPGDRFLVRTPVAVAAVRGTEFRVRHRRGISTIGVVEGEVATRPRAGATEVMLPAGSGEVVADGRGRTRALLPPPVVLHPGEVQADRDVEIDFAGPRALHHLVLAHDAGFVDPFAEIETRDPEAHIPRVDDGRIYLRVTSIDGDGVEGAAADYAIDRHRRAALAMVTVAPPPTLFRWAAAGDGTVYDLVLARDAALTDRRIEANRLATPHHAVGQLPPGTWFWQVTARAPGGDTARASPIRKLTIAPRRP